MKNKMLLKNISFCLTMEEKGKILRDVDILVEDGKIKKIGKINEKTENTIDGKNKVALPGLINTHHHFYQSLTRVLPKVANSKLFDWLVYLYEIWKNLSPEWVAVSTKVATGEMLLSGCTTSLDHYYVFPKGTKNLIDVEIEETKKIGMRLHITRGSMSLGRSKGGLPPDDVVQSEEEILKDMARLITKYHDQKEGAMTRVVNAPCSPFSVTKELLKESIAFARDKKIFSQTHLAETIDEEKFCLEKFGKTPAKYMEEVNWLGEDVSFAHCVHLSNDDIKLLGQTKTCVSHCPSSNLRLGSGIAPIKALDDAGATISIGVDGAASNDSSNILLEMRQALFVARVKSGVSSMNAYDVLRFATTGGAKTLGRDDIGKISVGKMADIALFDIEDIAYAGSGDPVAGLLFCGRNFTASEVIVNGKLLVKNKKLLAFDEKEIYNEAKKVFEKEIAPHL